MKLGFNCGNEKWNECLQQTFSVKALSNYLVGALPSWKMLSEKGTHYF
jgi:hypothetical protein